jgi:hypothetical protein
LTIQTEGNIQFVQILNLSGQVLLEQKIGELNIAHLASGTYLLQGTTSKGNFSSKIIKN